ncbi:hypothetical protein [Alteribacillus iranensis]|uniref:Uncharacterized protein n=1 Tax=Alteribacillus iranensis TaxID=930128 RepID=A0A1I2BVS7_9BACI|nr:hypothetical protein [Alteribacillus iranensis]SFE60177.1 hypothetical protein SAMN05192532_102534 [Alteribacillus iranensis]
MKTKIADLLLKGYGMIALVTLLLGLVVSLTFALSLVIGGSTGESLAVIAGNAMSWGIRLATVATLIGIAHIYVTRNHSLSLEKNESVNNTEVPTETNKNSKEAIM